MSDLIAGAIAGAGAQLVRTWREKVRVRRLHRRGGLSAPCALRIVEGEAGRWRHGHVSGDRDSVVWRSRTGGRKVVMRSGDVTLLSVRSPTSREGWFIRQSLQIHRVHSGDHVIDIALLPAEVRYLREALGLPDR